MKVSLEWIADFVELPVAVSPEELARELTLKTVEVEGADRIDGDVVFEIDNKSLTNRPDLWGHYGLAREFAAIYDLPLAPLATAARPRQVTGLVAPPDRDICIRFAALTFDLGQDIPTPNLIRRRLARIGADSISLCVDLANYVMFTVGQPMHVYDADRVRLPLRAVTGRIPAGFELLTGQAVSLVEHVPVIRDARGVVGLAGVMGGAASSVTAASRRFVLEAATFRPRPVRQASQRLALRTEESSRFEKGLDTQRVDLGVDMFLSLLRAAAPLAAGTAMQDVVPCPTIPAEVTVSKSFLDRRIGERLNGSEVDRTLGALGFGVRHEADAGQEQDVLHIAVPTWRSTGDVSLPDDILEEVARIHGYDNLATAQTSVTLKSANSLHRRSLERALREQSATRAGLYEVITYPWTSDELLMAAGLNKDRTVRFSGASAPSRDSLRPSLLPNLMEAIAANLRYQASLSIFEIGVVFPGGASTPYRERYETMPSMRKHLALALAGQHGAELFRRLKGILAMLRRYCHLADLTMEGDTDAEWADRSARLAVRAEGAGIGSLGLLTPRSRKLAGIEDVQVAYAELDLSGLRVSRSRDGSFVPLPDLPDAEFDLSLIVRDDIVWSRIAEAAMAASALITAVHYLGEYRGDWVPEGHRSLALRVTLRPEHSTLTAKLINNARGAALKALGKQFNARLR